MGFTYLQEVVYYLGEDYAKERIINRLSDMKKEERYLFKVLEMIRQGKGYEEISKEIGDSWERYVEK